MKDYIDAWCQDLLAQTPVPIRWKGEAWGECDVHTGNLLLYAKVKISIGPSDELRVIEHLEPEKLRILKANKWLDHIVYGVLDKMLFDITGPRKIFLLDILDVVMNDIESKQIAFRLAARDATSKITSGI